MLALAFGNSSSRSSFTWCSTAHASVDTGTSFFGSASESAFAMAFGGGLDYNLNKNFAVRVGQFDYLPTRFGDATQNNFRYSTGIVLKF